MSLGSVITRSAPDHAWETGPDLVRVPWPDVGEVAGGWRDAQACRPRRRAEPRPAPL